MCAPHALGDYTLEKKSQGYTGFLHPWHPRASCVRWFRRDLAGGDMDQCDTFDAEAL